MPGPSARGRDTRDGRFASHGLLRAYAAELADEDEDEAGRDEARQRLADHYLHTAAAAAGQLYPARPALSLRPAQPGTVPEQLTGYADAALAVWRRALAILEELHDFGAEEVRSRLGAKPGPAAPSVC